MSTPASVPNRYRFGDSARAGVLLGLSLRQSLPLVVGTLWLTLGLMVRLPLVGMVGPVAGGVVAFGRWRRAPLFEVALPGVRLALARHIGARLWTRASLLGAGPGFSNDLPAALRGLEILALGSVDGRSSQAVVRDRQAGSVSMVVRLVGTGFPVAALDEQDAMLSVWGGALAPLARAHGVVSRVTWQEWTHPVGVRAHRDFLAGVVTPGHGDRHERASDDYEDLLAGQAPFTVDHEVLLTVTVDLKRVRARRSVGQLDAAVTAIRDEMRLLIARLESAGITVNGPLSPADLSVALRLRSDPSRIDQLSTLRHSLAAAIGRSTFEWAPMAVEPDWFHVRVDGSVHRSYRVASWPMLPVVADWLNPLLTGDEATRTVTVVMEPVPLARAAADANRQLTSIESDQSQKERHGFRLTAREHRRHADVETRERELAEGYPEFRHVGIVTVTAADADSLEEMSARVEQAAAQSMLDLRPLAARQAEGWVAALPLGRSVRNGAWR